MTLSATVTGSAKTAVTWSLTGAGYLGGMAYNAPSTMPASSAVTITASLTSNPSITASYSLTLINPAPVIASTSATQLTAGATTSVTLTGTGFVPGTVLSVDSGGSVTATYQSPTTIVAQVTLPITAQGNANLQAQNGAPGGGTSAAFAIPVGQGIQLAASSPDGTNPAIARLGVPVNLTATVSPGNHQLLAWTVQGGGTITFSGTNYVNATYTPPQVMPSSASVTIVASLSSASTVTTSYALTLVNPVPSVTTESPAQVAAGIDRLRVLTAKGVSRNFYTAEQAEAALQRIAAADLEKIARDFPDYPYPSLLRALQVSVDALDPVTRERFLALAILSEDATIPSLVQEILWNADEDDALGTAQTLIERALAQRADSNGGLRLHDLLLDYLRAQFPDPKALRTVNEAMRLSSHVIGRDPAQLPSQLVGRLANFRGLPAIQSLLDRLSAWQGAPWLRPRTASLIPPGTTLITTLDEPKGGIRGVAVADNGQTLAFVIAVMIDPDAASRPGER